MTTTERIAAIAMMLIGALIAAIACADAETIPFKPLAIACLVMVGLFISVVGFKGR